MDVYPASVKEFLIDNISKKGSLDSLNSFTAELPNSDENLNKSLGLRRKRSLSDKALPGNFFENVIETEMELEKIFKMSTLLKLIVLYSV